MNAIQHARSAARRPLRARLWGFEPMGRPLSWPVAFMGIFATAGSIMAPSEAQAGGLYVTDRGVRALGRGGAMVAGADDIHATWYNPAGLIDAGTSLLVDASWLDFHTRFARQTLLRDSQNGAERVVDSATVSGATPFMPLPTFGGSYYFGHDHPISLAVSVHTPYAALTSLPAAVSGQAAASRYSLVSLDGSALMVPGAYLAVKPIESLRVGIGLDATVGTFATRLCVSASPQDRLVAAPEDPSYDAMVSLKAGPVFAPSAGAGLVYVPRDWFRIGLSGHWKTTIKSKATTEISLPAAPEFANAYVQGNDATVNFVLPAILRVGVEVRPLPKLRAEIAYVHEFWSQHDRIRVTPNNIALYDVVGVAGRTTPFVVSPFVIARQFQDSQSLRVGAEYSLTGLQLPLIIRAGLNYERSAIPNAYLSPLTVDMDKVVLSLGGAIVMGEHWRFDAVVAYVHMLQTTVDVHAAKLERINVVLGNATQANAINGGRYDAHATVVGLGANYKF